MVRCSASKDKSWSAKAIVVICFFLARYSLSQKLLQLDGGGVSCDTVLANECKRQAGEEHSLALNLLPSSGLKCGWYLEQRQPSCKRK